MIPEALVLVAHILLTFKRVLILFFRGRFEARISDELSKNQPCGGAVRRDLLEMELAALKRDRVSIEEKLLRVVLFDPLMNFQGEMSLYSADHGLDRTRFRLRSFPFSSRFLASSFLILPDWDFSFGFLGRLCWSFVS